MGHQRASAKKRRPPLQHPPRQPRVRFHGAVLGLVSVVALAVMAYLNALRNGFVLDDIPIIVENPLVRDLGNVPTIFGTNYWDRGGARVVGDSTLYRPLTVTSYAVDFALWELSPVGYHATNVVLHAAATAVVMLVSVEVLGSAAAAFAAASIFAVHPIHTEAVTSVVGRAEILATLLFLLALRVLRRRPASRVGPAGGPAPGRSIVRAGGGAALYLLGLFSKESAVTLPAVLALDDWLYRNELPRERALALRFLAIRYGALALALGVYLAFRLNAVSGGAQIWPGFSGVPTGDRILTASRVLMEYIGLFVFPRHLLADYWKTEVPIATSVADPLVVLSLLMWIAVGVLVVRRIGRDAAVVLSVGWFFITMAPISNVLFPIGVAKAERLLYLPSVGLCLLAGWGFGRVAAIVRAAWVPRVVLASILAALTVRTVVRNQDWRDNFTLATATLAVSPSSPLMRDIAAGDLVRRGNPKPAVALLQEAVRQAPDMPLIRSHLGAAYYSQGMVDQAITEYEEAIRRNPADAEARNNLGVAYLDKGREADAFAQFNAAIRLSSTYADPHINLGSVHLERARLSEAGAAFEAAVRADPLNADAHNALGVAYLRLGQRDRAAEQYREALRLRPDHAAARANLDRLAVPQGDPRAKP